ncbi:MAG: hypothetical protein CL811_02260 [Colwelliaceae bacterium]|nr:hypothetical protein [Colwelliaceae bacterium]
MFARFKKSFKKGIKQVVAVWFAFAAVNIASANLITNGSFEQLTFDDNSTSQGQVHNRYLSDFEDMNKGWDVFSIIPGWETAFGSGIEIQKHVVTNAQHGDNHVELDSHPGGASNSMMQQTLDSLVVGSQYQLEFFYKPRTNNQNDNGINVYWYDSLVDFDSSIDPLYSVDGVRRDANGWQVQTVTFTATSEDMTLGFASFGQQNRLGGLIDNVSLVAVPEPSMIVLLMLAVLAMMSKKARIGRRA